MNFIHKEENGIPIKGALKKEEIEPGALQQAINTSYLPFAFHHIALMPDVHQGYGIPIGEVLATKGAVVPNAVGKDIGCGMCAIKSSLFTSDMGTDILKSIMGKIREKIPMGHGKWHKEMQDGILMPTISPGYADFYSHSMLMGQYDKARKQLGTLGSGNHFIEIQKDEEDYIWIMIHSGSRNLGSKVADHYDKIAKKLNERWYSKVPKNYDLAFLPIESIEAKQYLNEMNYCVDFAFANRVTMMYVIKDIFSRMFGIGEMSLFPNDMVNIAHNYAKFENHYGKNVIVHRKGATLARKGTIGIIPGSQGSKSYIVKGLGNPESFMSCSHGAGRCMSRTAAKRDLNLEEEIKKLDDQGIIHGIRNQKDLDEAAGSYKDIEDVMEKQKDLVKIIVELSPLGCIKGD